MVKGLDRFREAFRLHLDQYLLIGGAACDILMRHAGLDFRATKDLDIVLRADVLDAGFVGTFWQFIRTGGYQIHESAEGIKRYYRFMNPRSDGFPFMLELFCRKPASIELAQDSHLIPVRIGESIVSLSAILMDHDYDMFLQSGRRVIDDVAVAGPEYLIPLKARAWLDLSSRKMMGAVIDSRSITKHKNDVFRLYRLVDPGFRMNVPVAIRNDVETFLSSMSTERLDLESLGIRRQSKEQVLEVIRNLYAI